MPLAESAAFRRTLAELTHRKSPHRSVVKMMKTDEVPQIGLAVTL